MTDLLVEIQAAEEEVTRAAGEVTRWKDEIAMFTRELYRAEDRLTNARVSLRDLRDLMEYGE